jgi:two-component system nitrate/nitrite response regulator NarL
VSEATTVLVVDDHALFRRGLRELLTAHGFAVVGEASNGIAAVRLAAELRPDVVVMDLEMPGMDGRAATEAIVGADLPSRVLILTISVSDADVLTSITAGACGYLLKDAEVAEIVAGVRAAAAGESMISPAMVGSMVRRLRQHERAAASAGGPAGAAARLTQRELEVLSLIIEGRENGEIAADLHLSASTVKRHVTALLEKLGVENRVQAAVYGIRHELV